MHCISDKTKVCSKTDFTRTHTFVFVNLHYIIFEKEHPALGNLWTAYKFITEMKK